MLRPIGPPTAFSIAKTRAIVKDLFTPSAGIYWTDFLASLGIGSVAYFMVRRTGRIWPEHRIALSAACYMVSVILYYRAALFIHELTHLRDRTFRAFRIVWNLLCGIPFLMPSFMYYSHVDHHMRKHFGTHDDGEYLPLGTTGPWKIVAYLAQPLIIPILAMARFLLLAPIGWLIPRFRRWLHQHASSLVMDPSYARPLPSRKMLRIFRMQEIACFLVCFVTAILLVRGRVPVGFLIQAYATAVGILYLNHVRTLGAHRYINPGGEMTFVDQLLDSVNYPDSRFLGEMAMPVGLRFHALHHLFPTLPYHNLARAHKRLMAELPVDSPYRATVSPGLWTSLTELWNRSKNAAGAQRPGAPSIHEPIDRSLLRQTGQRFNKEWQA
ncbi:MAG TPA: fatty acid desaturase [Pirellulales bacterium]|jgi:fatty acid desaturase|nr:fatty acid desaturase [Pirellulales bacterium]